MSAVLVARDLRMIRRSVASCFELKISHLEMRSSEVLAVLGSNGAGKSTLLRAFAGLEEPTAGEIVRQGQGPVTMVFQRPIALAGSVLHNVSIALRAQGLPSPEIRRRSNEALEHFGISKLAARPATALSGGELRRLALARAFALEPAVLLLDEPFDDLDAGGQETLSRDLRQAVAQTGVAVGVVTHDLRRAVLVSDRIAVLIDGQLRQVGERNAVLNHPADLKVARLVGMSNLIPAEFDAQGLGTIDALHSIPTGQPGTPGPGWIGIRPEHLKVDVGRGEGTAIGEGELVEFSSDGLLATLTIAWAGQTLRTHLVAGRGLARDLRTGDRVSLALRLEDVHVLRDSPQGEGELLPMA
ncbi:MAG: ABC transporter ATP-binding protein [Myxococcota bacterium]|jgi:ABC-type sulfate/molybdate transport systems ATPase subunit|nr:ABC transporter ATP-binding protein [Myxococcota bacterium]